MLINILKLCIIKYFRFSKFYCYRNKVENYKLVKWISTQEHTMVRSIWFQVTQLTFVLEEEIKSHK